MSDLAPWESGEGRKPFSPDAPTEKVPRRKAPARMPEIYQRQTEGIIVPSGSVVPRPQLTPRPLEARGRLSMIVLGATAALGLAWAGLSFVIFTPEAGALRLVYAGVGLVIAAAAGLVLLAEWPRINAYRTGNFLPAVLVYGGRAQIEKVVGPMGLPALTNNVHRGAGSGILSRVFDRSAHNTTPPEIVALHVNRGGHPELIGIEWDAVRELQRGDIVWYQSKGASSLLLFHKLIPYAPWVSQDEATRKEVFEALRVGEIEFKDRAQKQAMGQTKVFGTDASGNLVVGGQSAAPAQPQRGDDTRSLGLTAQGGMLGGNDQYDQTQQSGDTDPGELPHAGGFRLSDPDKPLGGHDYDQGDDNYQ
ncbi:MAG: hypothetical protein H6841_04605 [Planctomycetes bacterium]|nr:hypothetical protein [Planctomycetota bacterium]MCB9934668.1 hypothetical protein [Planctomycetota bacterium]